MGPYYLTTLLFLLGPIRRIQGMASIAVPERTITSQPKVGARIAVRTPDHVVGNIEFSGGAVGTIIQSFAAWHPPVDEKQPIAIFGTEGTIRVPDPNRFDLPVSIRMANDAAWREAPHTFVKGYDRSVGLADMAYAIRSGRMHRCNGELAFAALDAMQGFYDASSSGIEYRPTEKFDMPV